MSEIAIGIDVGGTKALAVVVDASGRVLEELRSGTPHEHDADPGARAAEVVADQVFELSRRQEFDVHQVPIGIGLPGLMRRDGHLAFAPNLQSASGADLGALVGESLGNPHVRVENDANCAALAEHEWGAGRNVNDFVMVTLGTGIGGGVIADGQLVRGHNGFAGEIGHMVVEAHGAPCRCGGHGCWERYASGGGLARLTTIAAQAGRLPSLVATSGGAELVRGEDVTAAAAAGSAEAEAVIDELGWWLALGLANLVAILDAGHFVIGGGLSQVADLFLPSVHRYLAELVEGFADREPITVVSSMFAGRSGAMGAALVAMGRDS